MAFEVKTGWSFVIYLSVGFCLVFGQDVSTDVICSQCSCVNSTVDCTSRDLRSPFSEDDWQQLSTIVALEVLFSGNQLTTLTRFPALPVQHLNLSSCSLETIDKGAFSKLLDLVTLDLSYNKLSTSALTRKVFWGLMVPESEPRQFTKLRYLSLAHNDIHSLPQELFNDMPNIANLDLSGNPLAYIDQVTMAAIVDLTKLTDLSLSGCELESLPEGIFRRQRRLERLDLSDNRFATVPSVLAEATNLLVLNFDKNPVEKIQENNSISSLSRLQELHICRMSKLQSIGANAFGVEGLSALYLSNNPRLTSLDPKFLVWEDDEVERWPVLNELHLNNNNLSEINSHILDRWDRLISVDVTNNPYVCDCSNQWMVDVLIPLLESTSVNGSANNMVCKYPPEMRGLTFKSLNENQKTLSCSQQETLLSLPPADGVILLGVIIGVFVTFPIVLILVLLWKKGYFTKCRGRLDKEYDEEIEDL